MITAKDFLLKETKILTMAGNLAETERAIIEFAKMHVKEAIKKANENTKTGVRDACGDIRADLVEKYILNAYSLDAIK